MFHFSVFLNGAYTRPFVVVLYARSHCFSLCVFFRPFKSIFKIQTQSPIFRCSFSNIFVFFSQTEKKKRKNIKIRDNMRKSYEHHDLCWYFLFSIFLFVRYVTVCVFYYIYSLSCRSDNIWSRSFSNFFFVRVNFTTATKSNIYTCGERVLFLSTLISISWAIMT